MAKRTEPATSVSIDNEIAPSCTRCGRADAEPEGYPRWCKGCRAEYQRNYRNADSVRARAEGFREGGEAMRSDLMNFFRKADLSGMLRVIDVLNDIAGTPAPKLKDHTQSSES